MTTLCLAVGAAQILFTLRFMLRLRALPASRYGGEDAPPVSVIVPCKGSAERAGETFSSLLGQDYAGTVEYLFVVPSRTDPLFGKLEALIHAAPDCRTRLLVSGAEPVSCSEKILNLLHGHRHASENSRILVFADFDLVFPRGWLSALVAPLRDPAVGCSTAHALPEAQGLPGELMRLWAAAGIVYLDSMGVVSGNSMAISKDNFAGLEVERAWRTSLCEDLTLAGLLKKSGKKVSFAAAAIPVCSSPRSLEEVFSLTNKWMLYFRFYVLPVWLPGAALTFFKFYAAARGLACGAFGPLLVLLASDMLNLSLVSAALAPYGGRLSRRQPPWRRLALAFLLQVLYAVNFIASALRREVQWGGYRYRLFSAGRVEVLP